MLLVKDWHWRLTERSLRGVGLTIVKGQLRRTLL
jgi:hypothetical protein